MSEGFSGLSANAWTPANATWAIQDGKADVAQVETGKMGRFQTSFYPSGDFSVDVDVDVLALTDDLGGYGLYIETGGSTYFTVDGKTVSGVGSIILPNKGYARLLAWDVEGKQWHTSDTLTLPSAITSVGITFSGSEAVLRINRQDTDMKFSLNLPSYAIIDRLVLMAQKPTTRLRFDNVCASPDRSASTLLPPQNFRYTLVNNLLTISWDAVAAAAGYKVGIGIQSGNYLGVLDFGNITQIGPIDVTGVEGSFYFAAKAYNSAQESGFSNEILINLVSSGGSSFTVDPDGGSVETGGIKIQFPLGAVDSPTPVIVSPAQPDLLMLPGATPLTGAYAIEIQGDLLKPLTIEISPEAADSGMAFGVLLTDAYVTMYDSTPKKGLKLIEASQDNGKYVIVLPASPPITSSGLSGTERRMQAPGDGKHKFTVWTIAGYNMKSSYHFHIRYPRSCNSVVINEWLQYAEEAYGKLVNGIKFDPAGLAMPLTRMTLDVVQLDSTRYGECGYHAWTLGLLDALNLEFNLNSRYCSSPTAADQQEMRATIGHEFFHALQYTYDPAPALIETVWGSRGLCLYDASSTWFEAEMLDTDSYLSGPAREQIFQGNAFYTKGLGSGCAADPQGYGYGAAAFLRYLSQKYGDGNVLSLWTGIKSGQAFVPLDAMKLANIRIAEDWTDFAGKLLLGTTGFGWQIPGPDATVTYSSAPVEVSDTMHQLSAKKYRLDFTGISGGSSSPQCRIQMSQGDFTTAYLYHITTQQTVATSSIEGEFTPIASDKYSLVIINSNDSPMSVNGVRYGGQNPVKISINCGPRILSIDAASGNVGTPVTISGSGFGAAQGTGKVTFNGVAATVSSWSDARITATVPAGATTGDVVVTVNGLQSNGTNFTVTAGSVRSLKTHIYSHTFMDNNVVTWTCNGNVDAPGLTISEDRIEGDQQRVTMRITGMPIRVAYGCSVDTNEIVIRRTGVRYTITIDGTVALYSGGTETASNGGVYVLDTLTGSGTPPDADIHVKYHLKTEYYSTGDNTGAVKETTDSDFTFDIGYLLFLWQ